MLTWLLNLLRPPKAPGAPVALAAPTYVGHETQEEMYSSAVEMKAFMDSLALPVGCTWFFL